MRKLEYSEIRSSDGSEDPLLKLSVPSPTSTGRTAYAAPRARPSVSDSGILTNTPLPVIAEKSATADAPVAAGAAVKVVSQENLTMKVEEIA